MGSEEVGESISRIVDRVDDVIKKFLEEINKEEENEKLKENRRLKECDSGTIGESADSLGSSSDTVIEISLPITSMSKVIKKSFLVF